MTAVDGCAVGYSGEPGEFFVLAPQIAALATKAERVR